MCGKDVGTGVPKTAALGAAVFLLFPKNLRGMSKHPPPPARRGLRVSILCQNSHTSKFQGIFRGRQIPLRLIRTTTRWRSERNGIVSGWDEIPIVSRFTPTIEWDGNGIVRIARCESGSELNVQLIGMGWDGTYIYERVI